ncbi:unnamed protein product [Ostreobium quekettii]|uniref:Chlorophyll a-b binding protein, chloroplastic n=1 Tax=Ostreobium quekettii TaxID=121088 RepID=A0A8S1J008_9CHLO|nr:unnamed protein product [Ostreobium quekettii]
MWLNGVQAPPYLDGSLPGDFGYDPLGLGSEPDRLAWYIEAEKLNGRWAMNGVLGVVATEALGIDKEWYTIDSGKDFGLPFLFLVSFQAVFMGFFEMKRYRGWVETGESGVLDTFPWDPLNQNKDQMALKEVKNGRLAMVAWVGFVAQAVVVRKGPLACLTDHLQDPFNSNILTNILKLPETIGTSAPVVQAVTEAAADAAM